MISKFFIERPVLANVLAILFVLIGAVSLIRLPVSQYPNVVPPTVQVTTRYPGASAQTVVDTVALPIELQVNGVENMLYMQSTSASDGTYTLTVTFAIGTRSRFRAGAGAEPGIGRASPSCRRRCRRKASPCRSARPRSLLIVVADRRRTIATTACS